MYSSTEKYYDSQGVLRNPGELYFDFEGKLRRPGAYYYDYKMRMRTSSEVFYDSQGKLRNHDETFYDGKGKLRTGHSPASAPSYFVDGGDGGHSSPSIPRSRSRSGRDLLAGLRSDERATPVDPMPRYVVNRGRVVSAPRRRPLVLKAAILLLLFVHIVILSLASGTIDMFSVGFSLVLLGYIFGLGGGIASMTQIRRNPLAYKGRLLSVLLISWTSFWCLFPIILFLFRPGGIFSLQD